MTRSSFLCSAALLLSVSAPPNALAVPVTFEFEGVIDTIFHATSVDPFGTGIAVGTQFKGRYTFDTTTPNTGTSDYGVYIHTAPQYGIDVQVGAFFGSSSTALLPLHYRIITGAWNNNGDVVQDIQTQDMSFGGVNAYLVQIFLEGPSTALSSVDLSATPPNLADYFVHTFVLGIGPPAHAADVAYWGQITSISAVPEPSTLSLVVLAALALRLGSGRRLKRPGSQCWRLRSDATYPKH